MMTEKPLKEASKFKYVNIVTMLFEKLWSTMFSNTKESHKVLTTQSWISQKIKNW